MYHLSLYAMTASFAKEADACLLQLPEWEKSTETWAQYQIIFH